MNEAWVIITRHPDFETEVEEVCGPPVNEVVIDLGADFDCKPHSKAEADEFFVNLRMEVHGAPAAVQNRIEELIAEYRDNWGF